MHVKHKTALKAYFREKLLRISNDIGGYCLCVKVSIMKSHKYGLLTKRVLSRWLDIGQFLILRVYG